MLWGCSSLPLILGSKALSYPIFLVGQQFLQLRRIIALHADTPFSHVHLRDPGVDDQFLADHARPVHLVVLTTTLVIRILVSLTGNIHLAADYADT